MNSATGIGDNTYVMASRETGTRGQETSEPLGEGAQQRFADVLPVAQAALEQPPEKGPAKKTPAQDRSVDAKVAVESSVRTNRPVRRRGEGGEDAPVDRPTGAWPFAEVVPPVVSPQALVGSAKAPAAKATRGRPATEPVVSGPGPRATERRSMPAPSAQGTIDAGPIPIRGQQAPKIQQPQLIQQTQRPQQPQQIQPPQEALAGEQSAGVRAVANIVTGVAIAKGQETALPVEAAGRQIPTVPRMPQETTTAPVVQVAQTMARGVRAGRAETPNERVQSSPGARVVNPAPQVNRQETPAPVKSAPGGQPGVAGEKPEHASAKTQPVNPQPTAGPETPVEGGKVPQGQALPVEGRQDRTSRFSAVARSEGPKAEAVQTNGKDTPSPDPKEAGAAMPEMRVSPVGDAVAPSPRLATQTQSQTSVDAPPVRSPVQSVGEQIRDSMHASAARGDRQILIRLNPPELGTVLVRFQEQGDHFNGTLEVSSRETRREIEQALPQVVRALQEAGVQIRRVEVVTSDQAESDPGGEHQPRDVWQQHQGTGQGREHSHGSSRVRWQQSAGGHSTIGQDTPDDEPQAAAAPGRIDVLL